MALLPDGLGWAATAIFASSYFCRGTRRLRMVQALASLVWASYGALIRAAPLIVANLVVASLALYSAWRGRPERIGNP